MSLVTFYEKGLKPWTLLRWGLHPLVLSKLGFPCSLPLNILI